MSEQKNQQRKKEKKPGSNKLQAKAGGRGGRSKVASAQEPGKSKANALRAKKRAAARKARKQRLIALLYKYDQARKAGLHKKAASFAAALRKEKAGKLETDKMRTVVEDQQKAEKAVEKQAALLNVLVSTKETEKSMMATPKSQRTFAVAEKKHADAVIQLKRAQQAEQAFFAMMMKLAKNGVCPFCGTERLSIDSHVMDMHPPQWGEYLGLLGRSD